MKTALLRLGERQGIGRIMFVVPGAPHPVKLIRPRDSFWDTWALSWPSLEIGGWQLRKARLDWHRNMVKMEIRRILVKGGSYLR